MSAAARMHICTAQGRNAVRHDQDCQACFTNGGRKIQPYERRWSALKPAYFIVIGCGGIRLNSLFRKSGNAMGC